MSLTLVSALYDLAGREANPRRRTVEDYLHAGEFLWALEADLVVFGDADAIAEVDSRRRLSGMGDRTVAVPLPLEDLSAHADLDRIAAAREENPIENANPDKDTPLYVCLQWGKFELVERAAQLDPFSASHLAWIDLGLPGRPHPDDAVFARPATGVRLLMMRPFAAPELVDRGEYFSAIRGHVAAGYISGERARMLRMAERFRALSAQTLGDGFAPSEEQLLPLLIAEAPDLFDFHHGDYPDILRNYQHLRTGAENLLFQLKVARDAGLPRTGLDICERILDSHLAGTLECSSGELAELLDECFLAAWFGYEDGDRELAREIARLYEERVQADPEFRDVFLRDEVRVRGNLELLRETAAR